MAQSWPWVSQIAVKKKKKKKLDKNLEEAHFKSTLESFIKNGYFLEKQRKNHFFQLNCLKIF